ncbi:MAG TPA: hypothetical protein VKU01_05995 [Bryobacteraceae bacterium]|nr:hypothetical protein [Bryobacteraceae bacterium]
MRILVFAVAFNLFGADDIATDRPSVTDSSGVAPQGSLLEHSTFQFRVEGL